MRAAYYNEHDAFAAAWLRELIADGLIAPGDVDERDIQQVRGDDLIGYTQCHFFAGIGGWSYALRLAGWPDDRPVWTGSCPCQPFSAAGKRRGTADERHLWPVFFDLIRECRPDVVFGEQVESAIRMGWLDGIRTDLEGEGYALGAAVLGAHSVGAPHIRQRLYWLADADGCTGGQGRADLRGRPDRSDALTRPGPGGGGVSRGLAHPDGQGQSRLAVDGEVAGRGGEPAVGLGDARSQGLALGSIATDGRRAIRHEGQAAAEAGIHGFWSRAEWLACSDGKARRVEPGIFPLASRIPNRVGTLRGASNAIVPQVAAEFISAYLDLCGGIDQARAA